MSVAPVFTGLAPAYGMGAPMEVVVENAGPDARGVVRVSGEDHRTDYPIEVPRGARKRLVVFAPGSGYGGPPEFSLITNRGNLTYTYQGASDAHPQAVVVGMISDVTGELHFITSGQGYVPVYAQPERTPDRPVGYSPLTALVLGPGAERMADEAVRAVQTWVVGGGTVVFVGGAAAPMLSDRRWAMLLPIKDAEPKTIKLPASVTRFGALDQQVTIHAGQPLDVAKSSYNGMVTTRSYGLGRVHYIAFNPFEQPLNRWRGRAEFFRDIVKANARAFAVLNASGAASSSWQNNYYGAPSSYGYPGYMERTQNNPFNTQLPKTGTVLLVLAAYFVLVVPVNFLLLRKLGKGELAWATAPVLSLAFAGVFFYAARGLYSAKLSATTNGVLVVQEHHPEAMLIAHSQLFFPRGGSYDLRLAGVDQLRSQDEGPYYGGRRRANQMLQPIDIGEVRLPDMSVPNLAFREIYYRQRVDVADWIRLGRKDGRLYLRNNSPYKLVEVKVVDAAGYKMVEDIESGQVIALDRSVSRQDAPAGNMTLASAASEAAKQDGCIRIVGKLEGFRGGPQIGEDVAQGYGVTLCVTTDDLGLVRR